MYAGSGKFTLNPFKKISEDAIGGKQILQTGKGALATAGAAGLAGAVNTGSRLLDKNNKWRDENGRFSFKNAAGNIGRAVGSGIAGTASASFRGAGKAIKGEKMGKIFADSYGEAMFAKKKRTDDLRRAGLENAGLGKRIGFGVQSIASDIARFTGNYTAGQNEYLLADAQDNQVTALQNESKKAKSDKANYRKNQGLDDLDDATNIAKRIESIVDSQSSVKRAKALYDDAGKRGADQAELDALYSAYKLEREKTLSNLYANGSIKNEVDRYNDAICRYNNNHDKQFDAKVQLMGTDVVVNDVNLASRVEVNSVDSRGNAVRNTYTVHSRTDSSGGVVHYYIDENGNRVDESSWSGAVLHSSDMSLTGNKVELDGVRYDVHSDATGNYIVDSTGSRVDESSWSSVYTSVDYVAKKVELNGKSYDIIRDSTGTYIIDSDGNRVDESSWSSVYSSVEYYRDEDGSLKQSSDNADKILKTTTEAEGSEIYVGYDAIVKRNDAKIEEIQSSQAYIDAHNANSQAKIADTRTFGHETEKPGYKPPAAPVQPRGFNVGTDFPPLPPGGHGNPPGGHGNPPRNP